MLHLIVHIVLFQLIFKQVLKMAEINEIRFRKFIKLRAQGVSKSRLMHRIGNLTFFFYLNLYYSTFQFKGITDKTHDEWAYKDDHDIPFFKEEHGGRPRKTSISDDQLLVEVIEEKWWSNLNDLKDDERIKALNLEVSDRTLYRRLNENGI